MTQLRSGQPSVGNALEPNRAARLLIVDDEPEIVAMLDEYFHMEGYHVETASNAEQALRVVNGSLEQTGSSHQGAVPGLLADEGVSVAGKRIDLILLDVNMPGMDGFELCRRIREYLSCPIIFLTARVEDVDQLDGFSAGGDDYVLKPFSLEVLGSRVRAHLMREARSERRSVPASLSVRIFSSITVDYARRTVEAGGEELELTRTEFDIVALLSKNPGRVFDRTTIYEQVWGWDATGDPSIVREHVRRVRKKLADAGCIDDPIQTVWGVGYSWKA